jgi:hypothetical protein
MKWTGAGKDFREMSRTQEKDIGHSRGEFVGRKESEQ